MKLRKQSTAIMVLSFGLGLLTTGLNRLAVAAESDKINVCYSSIAATSITTWVPKEAGIYKKYGLDVSIIYVARPGLPVNLHVKPTNLRWWTIVYTLWT